MNVRRSRWVGMLAVLALATPLFVVQPAFAAGTVTPSKTDLEDGGSGSWKLFITIKLGKKPPTAHRPIRFIFTPLTIYETFLDDSRPGEQTRSIPQGKDVAPLVETMDVSFGDVQGNLWDSTKFDFIIKRDRGFQAGEYQVELRDDENKTIGRSFKLKLGGKNEVIDRRAMVFAASDKKKKEKPEEKKDEAAPEEKKDSPIPPPSETKEEKKEQGAQPPPEVQPKQGGCGCQIPGGSEAPGSLAAVSILAVALGSTRRRSRRLVGPNFMPVASARGVPGQAHSPLDGRRSSAPRSADPPRVCPLHGRGQPSMARRRHHGSWAWTSNCAGGRCHQYPVFSGASPDSPRKYDLPSRVDRGNWAFCGRIPPLCHGAEDVGSSPILRD